MVDKNSHKKNKTNQSDKKITKSYDFTSKTSIERRNNDFKRYNITAQETNPAYDNFFKTKGSDLKKDI